MNVTGPRPDLEPSGRPVTWESSVDSITNGRFIAQRNIFREFLDAPEVPGIDAQELPEEASTLWASADGPL